MASNRPKINAKESSRTIATVFIDTHDRGQKFGGQRIDISEYITQLSIDSHIQGGGAASIILPAVDHFEDIIAASDLINIYLDTHRGDENVYNRGNVRVFFGYVESISKNISVSGDGSKITMYTIMCQDFGKAIRKTDIYNNIFLSHQGTGGQSDVVRDELKHNLGGMTLYARGMAFQGGPREVVLQNLMRCLGVGGQWLLPLNYSEGLPGSKHEVVVNASAKENTLFGDMKKVISDLELKFGKENPDSEFDFNVAVNDLLNALQNASSQKKEDLDAESIALLEKLFEGGKEFDPDELMKAMSLIQMTSGLDGSSASIEFKATIKKANEASKSPSYRPYLSNTFFKIGPALGPSDNPDKKKYGAIDTGLRPVIEQILSQVALESRSVTGKFQLMPSINHYADPVHSKNEKDVVQKAISIFNILCLDYMEDVDGNWNNFQWIHYQGSLWAALYDGANPLINELCFDLRPIPTFDNTHKKDGLGVNTNGALPMVPAVILREKPFTNYPVPDKTILNPNETGSIQIGGLEEPTSEDLIGGGDVPVQPTTKNTSNIFGNNPSKPRVEDQLFMASLAGSGGYFNIDEKFIDTAKKLIMSTDVSSIVGALEKLDIPIGKFYKPGLHKIANKIASITDLGDLDLKDYFGIEGSEGKIYTIDVMIDLFDKGELENVTDEQKKGLEDLHDKMEGLSNEDKTYILALLADEDAFKKSLFSEKLGGEIVSKRFSTITTLPRAVFRSPDGTRITKERKIATAQYILGAMSPSAETGEASFVSFSTNDTGKGLNTAGFVPSFGDEGSELSLAAPGSDTASVRETLRSSQKERWHCLDFMTIYPQEVSQETQYRGDSGIVNALELLGSLNVNTLEAQRLTMNNTIPILTPISLHRFGVRVQSVQTKFLNILNLRGGAGPGMGKQYDWDISLLMRWNVLLDMWGQHNHEYISGTMALRGMPGLRPGYRVDRPDLNLSFYVERVSHSWSYPGHMTTNISVTRGQPTKGYTVTGNDWGLPEMFAPDIKKVSKILPYYPPEPNVNSNLQQRQKLGQIFQVGETEKGKQRASPGTYTGQYLRSKVKTRDAVRKWLEKTFPDFKDLKIKK